MERNRHRGGRGRAMLRVYTEAANPVAPTNPSGDTMFYDLITNGFYGAGKVHS